MNLLSGGLSFDKDAFMPARRSKATSIGQGASAPSDGPTIVIGRGSMEIRNEWRRVSILPSSDSIPQLDRLGTCRHSSAASSGGRGISIVPRRISGLIRSESVDLNLLRRIYVASRPPQVIAEELGRMVETSYPSTLRLVRELCSERDFDEVEALLQTRTRSFIDAVRGFRPGRVFDSMEDLRDSPTLEEGDPPRNTGNVPESSGRFPCRFLGRKKNFPENPRSRQSRKSTSSLGIARHRASLSDWVDSHQFIEWLIEFLFILWYSSMPVENPRESVDMEEDPVSYIAIRQSCKQIVWSSKSRVGDSRKNHMRTCFKSVLKFLPWSTRMLFGEEGPKGESRWSDVAYDPFQRSATTSSRYSHSRLLHWFTLEFDNPYMEKSFQVDMAGDLMKTPYWPFFATVMLAFSYITVVYGFLKNDYPSLTFVRLLITEPVTWLLVAAVIQLVSVTVLFAQSQRFKENYFLYQFVLGSVICCVAAVWMYQVRNLFVFIAWPIAEGFTMAFILISMSCLFYIRFVYLLPLCGIAAIFTACMRVALCGGNHACELAASFPLQQTLAIVGALALVFSGRYLFESHSRLDFFMYRNLYRESERSDRLLLNILPSQVIQHLKNSGPENEHGKELHAVPIGIAQAYDKVSILFTDVVSFTTFSSHIAPEELVLFLNELFTAFDNMAEETGMEKIKTIGDAYLCISGLPNPDPMHAAAAARMGMKISALMRTGVFKDHNNLPLGCRIGIHSGSVVAGVIGRKKFIYDIWGDAVNTASRMESTGDTNRIHCSEDTAELLRHQALPGEFSLTCRGEIQVKGKGSMKTYWIDEGTGHVTLPDALPVAHLPQFQPIVEEPISATDSSS